MSLSSIPLLEEFISELLKRISDLEAIIVKLQEENAALKSEIARLSAPNVKNGADCYSKIGHAVTVLTWQS